MHTETAIRNAESDGLRVPTTVVMGAAMDKVEINYLEQAILTTMRMTTDDRTRRDLRVKMDALNAVRTASASAPDFAPTR